jgi:hypothetical protein
MLKFSYIVFYEKQIFVTISTNDSVDTERLADWYAETYAIEREKISVVGHVPRIDYEKSVDKQKG